MHADKKIVIFGAGKIGRSFIGQLFSRGGLKWFLSMSSNQWLKL